MKVLDKIEGFGSKVNFVDENNVCVGYETGQDCCEDADWFVSEKPSDKAYDDDHNKRGKHFDLEGFVFDKNYFEEVYCDQLDDGEMVRFKLVNGKKELFLHLYNNHNGYYGHGFEFMDGDKTIQEGVL